nr:hypothetical protein Iba_chr14cCG5000 [Ipomoea batatas]
MGSETGSEDVKDITKSSPANELEMENVEIEDGRLVLGYDFLTIEYIIIIPYFHFLAECILVSCNDIYSSRMARYVLSKMPGKVLCKAGIGKTLATSSGVSNAPSQWQHRPIRSRIFAEHLSPRPLPHSSIAPLLLLPTPLLNRSAAALSSSLKFSGQPKSTCSPTTATIPSRTRHFPISSSQTEKSPEIPALCGGDGNLSTYFTTRNSEIERNDCRSSK